MELNEEFKELQNLFAQRDMLSNLMVITAPRRRSQQRSTEFLLLKMQNIKIKIYQEAGHKLPHIHIDYGKKHHVASYCISTGNRLEGDLSKQYDSDVKSWLERNRGKLLDIWSNIQNGNDAKELRAELTSS